MFHVNRIDLGLPSRSARVSFKVRSYHTNTRNKLETSLALVVAGRTPLDLAFET